MATYALVIATRNSRRPCRTTTHVRATIACLDYTGTGTICTIDIPLICNYIINLHESILTKYALVTTTRHSQKTAPDSNPRTIPNGHLPIVRSTMAADGNARSGYYHPMPLKVRAGQQPTYSVVFRLSITHRIVSGTHRQYSPHTQEYSRCLCV